MEYLHSDQAAWRPFGDCLGQFGLLLQNTLNCLDGEQQEFISHSSRGWTSKIRVPGWSSAGGCLFYVADH